MKSELIIDVQPKEVSIAVLEENRLVELQRERQNISYSVGDIYLGTIKKVMPGLNAAFVEIGHEKEAFLHYRDLGSGFKTAQQYITDKKKYGDRFSAEKVTIQEDLPKEASIADVLNAGDHVMVQISKEAISTKGPRLTTELSFAGRYLVLLPFSDKVSVSLKIRSSAERRRLKQLILSIKPKNVTVIIRTSAEGVKVAELDHELRKLVNRWNKTMERLGGQLEQCTQKIKKGNNIEKPQQPPILHEETSRTLSLLRDTYTSDFKDIYINDCSLAQETKEYIDLIDPGRGDIVHYYNRKDPIFDYFDITRQIKQLFGKSVTYKSGAYLIIEQTEAMHVIDVNSGNRAKGSTQQEDTAIDVNLAAAEEIARQLRLRDLGGIIVIDFIDMAIPANRQKLLEYMSLCMKGDRAKHTILPVSKFGLMQITRQRVRPAMIIETEERCPSCLGTGKVQPSLFFTDQLEQMIQKLTGEGVKKFELHIHPFVYSYVTSRKGFLGFGGSSIYGQWKQKYSRGITLVVDQSLGMLDYQFFDQDKNELSHILDDVEEEQVNKR